MNNEVLVQAARPMLAFIFDLGLEWAPSLLTLGLVLIVLYFTRFKLSVAYLTLTAGLWLTVLGWRTVQFLLHLSGFEHFWSLFLSAYTAYRAVGPSLIAAGLAGVLLAMRVASEKGVSYKVSKLDYVVVLSVIVTASVGWLSWFSALEALAAGLISWIVWHFLSIPIATTVIRSRLRRNDVLVRWQEGASVLDNSAPRIFGRSLLLIALVVNVAPWLVRYLGPPASDPLQYGASLVHYSWYILPTFGLFLGPLKWLMEETGIRRYESKRQLLEPMRIPSLFQGLVGATAFISVALATYELANEVTTGLTILFLILVTTLPSALLPTFIYAKLSGPSRSVQLLSRLTDEGVLKPHGSVTIQRPEMY